MGSCGTSMRAPVSLVTGVRQAPRALGAHSPKTTGSQCIGVLPEAAVQRTTRSLCRESSVPRVHFCLRPPCSISNEEILASPPKVNTPTARTVEGVGVFGSQLPLSRVPKKL